MMVNARAAVRRRTGIRLSAVSALIVASASPCVSFVIPAAPISGAARGMYTNPRPAGLVMMASNNRGPPFKNGARPFSGVPQQLGALAAAVVAGTTGLPSQAAAAAESLTEVAQASVASSATDQVALV